MSFHEFYNLSRLSSLTLRGNYDLNFDIPVQLVNLTSLSILDLSDCELQGSVPYLPQLTKFDVSGNSNLLPDLTRMFQQKWPKLQRLSISVTNASGPFPDSISNAPLLVDFDAFSCRFEGSLPSSISNLSQLQSLDLSENSITGYIHSSISNLKSLRTLVLAGNNLQGSIPKSISNLKSLRTLYSSGNNLQGSIPKSISNLKSSRTLYLSGNNLQGSIPKSISNLKFLRTLDLSGNNLQGSIPESISNLTFLRTLVLSYNAFNDKFSTRNSLPSILCFASQETEMVVPVLEISRCGCSGSR